MCSFTPGVIVCRDSMLEPHAEQNVRAIRLEYTDVQCSYAKVDVVRGPMKSDVSMHLKVSSDTVR